MPPCDPGRPDFPGPVLPLACPPACLPGVGEAKALTRMRPYPPRFAHRLALREGRNKPGSVSGNRRSTKSGQVARVPLPRPGVTGSGVASHPPPRGALPPRRRSCGLMRPTKSLPSPSGSPSVDGSSRVAVSPRCEMVVPSVSSESPSLRAWTPTPAAPGVHMPVSSPRASAFPAFKPGRRLSLTGQRLLGRSVNFGAAVISLCSGPQVCSPSRSLPPHRVATKGGHDSYVRAEHESLPHRASDTLAV